MNSRRMGIASVVLIAFGQIVGLPGHAQAAPDVRATSALFKQFETVAYTKSDILTTFEPRGQIDSATDLRLPFVELIAALEALGPRVESDIEKRYSAILVGAKDFGGPVGIGPGPDGLGMVNSRKCYIAIIEGGAQPNLEADFDKASEESIGGVEVWTWSVPQYEGSKRATEFYAAQVGGSYFVMANSRQEFLDATTTLATPVSSTSSSIHLPGWETVSTHDYWIYRIFRRSEVRSAEAAGTRNLAGDVTALTFFANPATREGFVRVLSDDTSTKNAPNLFHKTDLNRFQSIGNGVWQQEMPLTKDEAGVDALFELFYRFGFGVAL